MLSPKKTFVDHSLAQKRMTVTRNQILERKKVLSNRSETLFKHLRGRKSLDCIPQKYPSVHISIVHLHA